jgi:hypothetical protein
LQYFNDKKSKSSDFDKWMSSIMESKKVSYN